MAKKVIQSTDSPKNSRVDINSNFTELYEGKNVIDAAEKTALADADLIPVIDSEASNALKYAQYQNLKSGGGMNNHFKNGLFKNCSTNGYGGLPDDLVNSNANPVNGSVPKTKQELIDLLTSNGDTLDDGDIEGFWPLDEASGNATDLSSNNYPLTDNNTVLSSDDGIMGKARDFEKDNSEFLSIADANCANLEISGSQTWFCVIKPESLPASGTFTVISKRSNYGGGKAVQISYGSAKNPTFTILGLSANVVSPVVLETGKFYLLIGTYDSAGGTLSISVNGITTTVAVTGTKNDTDGNFVIGGQGESGEYYDGLIECAGVLSKALTVNQRKSFANYFMAGLKIRRATTDAYVYQDVDIPTLQLLRGKEICAVCEVNQSVASTAQISIEDGTDATPNATDSAASATTGSYIQIGVTKTISATANRIRLKLKHSTSDGYSHFRRVALYEGGTLIWQWYPSADDMARFPRLLKGDIPAVLNGYSFEENRWFTWVPVFGTGYNTVTVLSARFLIKGKTVNWILRTTGTCTAVAAFTVDGLIPRANTVAYDIAGNGRGYDSGFVVLFVSFNNTSKTQIYIERVGNWTATSGKELNIQGFFEID